MAASLRLISPEQAQAWSEEDIKQLAARNPRSAMELAIRKWRQPLFYHASYIVKDGQEAYDLVQEVFIRAMREKRFFQVDFKMKAWLFRVTSNLCFNIVRDRRRRGAILEHRGALFVGRGQQRWAGKIGQENLGPRAGQAFQRLVEIGLE